MSLPTGWPVAKSTCQHWTCYPEVAKEACCICNTTQCHSHDPRSDDMLRATGTQSPAAKIRRSHNCADKHSPQLPPCGNWRLCKQTANTLHYKPQTMSWTQPSRRRKPTLQSSVCTESNRPSNRHKSMLIKSHSVLPRHPKITRHSLRLWHHNYLARNRAKPPATNICPPQMPPLAHGI